MKKHRPPSTILVDAKSSPTSSLDSPKSCSPMSPLIRILSPFSSFVSNQFINFYNNYTSGISHIGYQYLDDFVKDNSTNIILYEFNIKSLNVENMNDSFDTSHWDIRNVGCEFNSNINLIIFINTVITICNIFKIHFMAHIKGNKLSLIVFTNYCIFSLYEKFNNNFSHFLFNKDSDMKKVHSKLDELLFCGTFVISKSL